MSRFVKKNSKNSNLPLEIFEEWVKSHLIAAGVLHCDETGININSSREWVHSVSNIGKPVTATRARRTGYATPIIFGN